MGNGSRIYSVPGGMALTTVATLMVSFLLARLALTSGQEESIFPKEKPSIRVLLGITFLIIALIMLLALSSALAWGYTAYFGTTSSFETTVESKTKARSRYMHIKESGPWYVMSPRVDIYTWNDISPGDKIIIQGRESIFGVSITDIRRKHQLCFQRDAVIRRTNSWHLLARGD